MDRYSKTRLRRGHAVDIERDVAQQARRGDPVSAEAEALLLGVSRNPLQGCMRERCQNAESECQKRSDSEH